MALASTARTSAIWALYVLVVLEFLFMITPFLAFWYYPAYSGFLNWLRASPKTDWLPGFFLPHFSETHDPALQALSSTGWWLVGGGLLVFAITAAQVYWAKFVRRTMVHGGLYRMIRHPQYVALIVAGTGVMLIWPRFIVLFALVTMAFLYVQLARHEERVCLAKFGDGYRDYKARTGGFFPRISSPSRAASENARRGRPWLMLAAYVVAIASAGVAAYGLREHSMAHLAAIYGEREVILSPALLSEAELRRAHALAVQDPRVSARLAQSQVIAGRVTYVVPTEWYMPDLPILSHDRVVAGGHGAPKNFDRNKLQVLFTVARTFRPEARGKNILRRAHGIRPIALADVDLASGAVTEVIDPPRHVVWGDIPMPLF